MSVDAGQPEAVARRCQLALGVGYPFAAVWRLRISASAATPLAPFLAL